MLNPGIVLVFLVAGVILLSVEVMMPGFGLPGISGLVCIFAGIFFMAPNAVVGAKYLMVAFLAALILLFILIKVLGKSKYLSRFILNTRLDKEEGYISQKEDFSVLIGQKGRTQTALRPAGIVILESGRRLDVVSEGEFIESGQWVIISRADGPRILVTRHPLLQTGAEAMAPDPLTAAESPEPSLPGTAGSEERQE
ncbi:MAG: NfeD family protein [Peptococcaceae bacterium]|nr:NfeD family protein [Peptococcaceae bacterium]